ncbi:MAG: DUF4116 domain-containing protein [Treponema sp.]|jgi:hypothetical protein|nr:DUF4116 domain-containing protein [Treponema sp.]
MDKFHLDKIKIICVGEAGALKKIKTDLKTDKWEYRFIKRESKITYHKDRIEFDVANNNQNDGFFHLDNFYLFFKNRVREKPETAFIFDIYYHGKDGGCNGSGRYYCVYEGAKKMYDAGCWLEGNERLNYDKYFFEGGYGYEHYLELKKEGKLPSLNAVPTGYKFQLFFFDYDETDEKKALSLVKKDGMALEDVPEELKTYNVCLEAVRNFGLALSNVPEKHKTAELCLEAVRQEGFALEDVPEELRTAELCFEAVRNDGIALFDVPEKYKTAELCLKAVRQEGFALTTVPEELKTAELCFEAVRGDGRALQYVPEKLQSQVKITLEKEGVFIHYEGDDSDVLIPKGITAIAGHVFRKKEMTHITLPEGLTSIGALAFCNCVRLTSIYIPKSVTEIGSCAFSDCYALKTIYMSRKTALKFNGNYGPFHGCPGKDHIRYYEDEEDTSDHI